MNKTRIRTCRKQISAKLHAADIFAFQQHHTIYKQHHPGYVASRPQNSKRHCRSHAQGIRLYLDVGHDPELHRNNNADQERGTGLVV